MTAALRPTTLATLALVLTGTGSAITSQTRSAPPAVPTGLVVIKAGQKSTTAAEKTKIQNPSAAQFSALQNMVRYHTGTVCRSKDSEFAAVVASVPRGSDAPSLKDGTDHMKQVLGMTDPKAVSAVNGKTGYVVAEMMGQQMVMLMSKQGLPEGQMMILQCNLQGKSKVHP